MNKSINNYRRKITKYLTENIGKNSTNKLVDLEHDFEFKRILISRPNHRLGNLLLVTPLIAEIENNYPNCKVDVFAKGGLGPILFSQYKNIDTIYQLPRKPFKAIFLYLWTWIKLKSKSYDLVINVAQGSSSGRLSTKVANSKLKLYNLSNPSLAESFDDYFHMAKNTVYNFRDLVNNASAGSQNVPCLDLKLTTKELENGKALLNQFTDSNKEKTILLFTYATGAKCYSKMWWTNFYNTLCQEFKSFNIIEVLPVENISQIDFKAPSFYSKDVREIGAFIANADLFIGADSGIMHLASASLTTTVGLFSRTNTKIYEPYGNSSIALDTRIMQKEEDIIKVIKSKLNLVYDLV